MMSTFNKLIRLLRKQKYFIMIFLLSYLFLVLALPLKIVNDIVMPLIITDLIINGVRINIALKKNNKETLLGLVIGLSLILLGFGLIFYTLFLLKATILDTIIFCSVLIINLYSIIYFI